MRYSVEDTTLIALGDAIRANIAGETKIAIVQKPITEIAKTNNAYGFGENDFEGPYENYISYTNTYTIPGAVSLKVDAATHANGARGYVYAGPNSSSEIVIYLGEKDANGFNFKYRREQVTVEGDTVTVYWKNSGSAISQLGYYIEITGYDANGNVLIGEAEEEVKNTLTLAQMTEEINNIPPGLPEEALVITGDCVNRFSYNGWNWFVELYGDKITTQNLGNGQSMFYYSDKLTSIPFALNFNLNTTTTLASLFENCYELRGVPKIVGKTRGLGNMFTCCNKLRVIPEDYFADVDFTPIKNDTSPYGNKIGGSLFNYCYSLRSMPLDFLANENQAINGSYNAMYYYLFTNCRNLDEIVSLPVNYRDKGITSNLFTTTFSYCYRLKNMTFAVQEDGTPYTAKWKSQVVDLSVGVGYGSNVTYVNNICGYNSGVTEDKEVKDDATYQALKDDPDWFTLNVAYSRYNHDSAVATINSLPDTSAYGTNTIKFTGASGELTDGGAINTLTEEEIAVAAAKGWTVTLV